MLQLMAFRLRISSIYDQPPLDFLVQKPPKRNTLRQTHNTSWAVHGEYNNHKTSYSANVYDITNVSRSYVFR